MVVTSLIADRDRRRLPDALQADRTDGRSQPLPKASCRCRGDLVRFVCHRARRTFVDRELEHIGPRVVTDDIEV